MEVVLLKDDVTLGDKGEIVKVTQGFARNYLFPQGIAKEANIAVRKHLEAINKQRQKKLAKEKEVKAAEVKALESKEYVIKVKLGKNGKIFGSVTHSQIADVVSQVSGLRVDKRKIFNEDVIKKVGRHAVTIKYFQDLEAKIKIKVESDGTEVEEAAYAEVVEKKKPAAKEGKEALSQE